jgi:hypothetical protein
MFYWYFMKEKISIVTVFCQGKVLEGQWQEGAGGSPSVVH